MQYSEKVLRYDALHTNFDREAWAAQGERSDVQLVGAITVCLIIYEWHVQALEAEETPRVCSTSCRDSKYVRPVIEQWYTTL